jgi:hypothetical protein
VLYLDSTSLAHTLPCLTEPGEIIGADKPDRTLDLALPYMATLPGVIAYNPAACTLIFRRPHRFMTLYSD